MKTHKEDIQFLINNRWQMFTEEGAQALAALVDALEAGIKAGFLTSKNLAEAALAGQAHIEKTHGEVTDTEPRSLFFYLVGKMAVDNFSDTEAKAAVTRLGVDTELMGHELDRWWW